jgi:hypothetical protein
MLLEKGQNHSDGCVDLIYFWGIINGKCIKVGPEQRLNAREIAFPHSFVTIIESVEKPNGIFPLYVVAGPRRHRSKSRN